MVAGIAVCNLGHANPEVAAALKEQADRLFHCSNLYNIPQQELVASMLSEHSFPAEVFFCNSGAEANEGAIKLVRKYCNTKARKARELSPRTNPFTEGPWRPWPPPVRPIPCRFRSHARGLSYRTLRGLRCTQVRHYPGGGRHHAGAHPGRGRGQCPCTWIFCKCKGALRQRRHTPGAGRGADRHGKDRQTFCP